MEHRCPVCHEGFLEEVAGPDGVVWIQCSRYPACRFTTDSWEALSETGARFHHPVTPGHS
jgi:ssDNA-binding Zn-finger/Zn-ribbon topoisomerase 1